jgi:hypothetical protein
MINNHATVSNLKSSYESAGNIDNGVCCPSDIVDDNVDDEYEEATKYEIRSVPTVIIVKDGVEVKRINGLSSKSNYIGTLNEHLNN